MKTIIRIYALILLAYTGWRTYDFMILQLPAGQTSTLLSLLFLFATEIGLIVWHEINLNDVSTHQQQTVSTAMIIVDFIGSLSAGIADMILRQTLTDYQIPPLLILFLLYGLPLLVAANVAAVLLYLHHDSETQINRSKRQLRFEITRQALEELHDHAGEIAAAHRGQIYQALKREVTGAELRRWLVDSPPATAAPTTARPTDDNGRPSTVQPKKA